MINKQGVFIVIDGVNGAGKSTQVKELEKYYVSHGYDVLVTREPGGSPESENIRDLLVNGEPGRWDPLSELMLFSVARRNLVETVIKPALLHGKLVILDRFIPSTIAYQGYGNGNSLDHIKTLIDLSIGDFKPDLTILMFMADPNVAKQRAILRRKGSEARFVTFDDAYHTRVYEGYTSEEVRNYTKSIETLHITEDATVEMVTSLLINLINKIV